MRIVHGRGHAGIEKASRGHARHGSQPAEELWQRRRRERVGAPGAARFAAALQAYTAEARRLKPYGPLPRGGRAAPQSTPSGKPALEQARFGHYTMML